MAETYPLPCAETRPTDEAFARWNETASQRAKECGRAPMPSLDHLTTADYDKVYEPSDDTYLLLDALRADLLDGATSVDDVGTVVEIGSGAGVVTTFLATRLASSDGRRRRRFYATDANPDAVAATERTARANGLVVVALDDDDHDDDHAVRVVRCDLASALLPGLAGAADVVVLNPPYVPTPDDEVGGAGIEASWAGGARGRVVVDRALPQIAALLRRPRGVAYLVTVDENLPHRLAEETTRDHGLTMVPFLRRRAKNEHLTVHKLTFSTTTTR